LGQSSGIRTENKVSNTEIKFPSTYVKKLGVRVKNFGIIPEGRRGGGQPAWLFVGEIVIR